MNIEDYLNGLREGALSRSDLATLLSEYGTLHGPETVQALAMQAQALGKPGDNPFLRGAIRADSLPESQEPTRLWFGLYPRSLALFIGESGAGKSSALYNLCIHAARNEPLWGVKFGLTRPLRVLYIDPENSGNFAEGQGGQCAVKIERIGQGKPKDLTFHDGQGVDLTKPAHLCALQAWIEAESFDVVVLDPIANLFGTKDENDNAEAARQMTALTGLSRETGACIVAVHHTGKDTGGNYGRGASARLGAADVAFVFRAKGASEEADDTYNGTLAQRDDQCRLQITKNRIEGRGSLYLQMAGEDKFDVSTFAAWKDARGKADAGLSKSEQVAIEIKALLTDGNWHSRTEILDSMHREGFGRDTTDAGLVLLEKKDLIVSTRKGRGGTSLYKHAEMLSEDENRSFLVSGSAKGNRKLGNFDEEANTLVKGFMDETPTPEVAPETPLEGGWIRP